MKHLFLLIMLLSLAFQSCQDDFFFTNGYRSNDQGESLGDYNLSPGSLESMPYYNKGKVFFHRQPG